MENIENIKIQQVQPSTLNNIRRFITEWNQDPVSQTSGLIIAGTQVSISNGVNVIPLSLPVEELKPKPDRSLVDSEKDYFRQIRNDLL
ncbi:38249_t:CDS:2, partial [Gigaspora margarita]